MSEQTVTFETGSKRCADVAGGSRAYPLRYDLLPVEALRRWAETMGEGSLKYSDRNWEKGQPASVIVNHAIAHLLEWLDGDRSEDHLGHCLFNLGALCHFEKHKPELIDTPIRGK